MKEIKYPNRKSHESLLSDFIELEMKEIIRRGIASITKTIESISK
jgi:hypothetical protein